MSKELLLQAVEALTYARACLAPYSVNTGKLDDAIDSLTAAASDQQCPLCEGKGSAFLNDPWGGVYGTCPDCHGTGK